LAKSPSNNSENQFVAEALAQAGNGAKPAMSVSDRLAALKK